MSNLGQKHLIVATSLKILSRTVTVRDEQTAVIKK
jgi:hypothetical protein